MLVYITHGSSGIGPCEWNIASFFLSNGYQVALLDYFTQYDIPKLFWDHRSHNQDRHTVPFKKMFDNATIPDFEKIVHIGCSLGGFFGMYHANQFVKNYCFYPGILAFNNNMLTANYSNTTVFLGNQDTWCDNYFTFHNQCNTPPTAHSVAASHGFMIPNKDTVIPIAKYNTPTTVIADEDFAVLIPNHIWLALRFGFKPSSVLLQHNEIQSTMLLNLILNEIKNI